MKKPGAVKTAGNIVINQMTISQIRRENLDIQKWRDALKSAESIYNPNRSSLYDIFTDVLLDAHLSAVIQKRKASVLNLPLMFVRDGDNDEQLMEHLSSPWFGSFLSDLLDTPYWGFSVFQFFREGEWINYELIPRKHIRPEKGLFLLNQTDKNGIEYRNGAFHNILEAGERKDLGLLLKAAPYVIYKRNGLADFVQFAELFGQPLREGIYDRHDEEGRAKLKADMEQMGSSPIFIHPENTQIKLVDTTTKSGSTALYKDLISVCNAEISKLILGNTLTTEQGDRGSQSLGNIHQNVEKQIISRDKQFVLNVLNYLITDILANMGINTQGGEFIFEDKENVSLKDKVLIDSVVAEKVPVNDDYWYEKYGIPKPDNYEELRKKMDQSRPAKNPQPVIKEPSARGGRYFNFFDEAPQ